MDGKCQECGAQATAEEAFCLKCGAVIGADRADTSDSGWDMPSTLLGQKFASRPEPEAATKPAATPADAHGARRARPASQAARTQTVSATTPRQQSKRSGAMLAFISFLVVLVAGGILILLLYVFL